MIVLPSGPSGDCCGGGKFGMTRRDLLRVGGSGLLGLSLGSMFQLQARADEKKGGGGPGWGKAKHIIMCYLQGGPSHLDLWDPKENVPDNVKSVFRPIPTKTDGLQFCETLPKLAAVTDKATIIHSMSYSPNGLFNHTAAIYQIMTGYTPDRVSPSGQLEPPAPNDFPHFGSQISKIRPPDVPMLPLVMLPRPLQESNVIGKGGTAGFLGPAYDPYYMYQDPNGQVNLDDFALRQEVSQERLQNRARLLDKVNAAMPEVEKAVASYALDSYSKKALELILSGRARDAFDLTKEPDSLRDKYGRHTFGQGLLMARRLVEAGCRVVQMNWPAVANGNPTVDAWDTHAANFGPIRNLHGPKLDSGLAGLLEDMEQRGLLKETLVLAIGEFGRSPRMGVSTSGNANAPDGRDHWPYCYTALVAGAGIKRGSVYGKSDATGSSPAENPVHPIQLLATVYHAMGIDPSTVVMNHLNQPRELVQAEPVTALFGS